MPTPPAAPKAQRPRSPSILVPRRLHFIWWQGAAHLPGGALARLEAWSALNPAWKVTVWDQARITHLLAGAQAEVGAAWRRILDAYLYDIQRVDFARLVILWAAGGIYSDLDMLPLRPIDPLVAGRHFYICREHEPHLSFCNAFLAATPEHPAIALMIEALAGCQALQARDFKTPEARVFATTGPAVITRVVGRLAGHRDPGLAIDMDPRALYPVPWAAAGLAGDARTWASAFPETYAVHLWAGAWRRSTMTAMAPSLQTFTAVSSMSKRA